MRSIRFLLPGLLIATLVLTAAAQKSGDQLSAETLAGLRFRSLGPAITSGRVVDLAVHPATRSHYYVAVASGGVWKTTNAGTTFEPVFDGESSYSIGCVAIDPTNPHAVWVGSGENNSQRSVSWGDGVYKSEDGGRSWKNMGLKRSEHIGKILVDPRDGNVVYVAAQGPLWGPGGDRGLYKTTNGGASWDSVLTISRHTGVTDVIMDPRNPDVLYAAAYQRRRHVWTLIDGGPESAIYRSQDAGRTWTKLSAGLPSEQMGRIGLAISPVHPDVLYAIIELPNRRGGVWRSTDRGASWEKRSDGGMGTGQYYSELFCDPVNVDRVYAMDVMLKVTDDGAKTWRNLGEKAKHVDNHVIWVDPREPSYYLVGGDGGLYESFDRGRTWKFLPNLPVTQFYRVAVDDARPFYNIYGGTQDNFTLGGPSRTVSASGIHNFDWIVTTGGDGFTSRVDPTDPNIVYSQSQYGGLVRFDKRSGEAVGIKPVEGSGEPPLRWNWDAPLIISPHSPTRLYFAANRLFRSDDRGDSWRPVSPDLTRQIDRNTLSVMDRVWGVDAVAKNASTSLYGNIVALTESPAKEGLLAVGTDDGRIQVSEDGGGTWRAVDRFPGVPERTYVSRLETSVHGARTLYAAFDNHKNADFRPYVLKSDDAGRSWSSIAGNLPEHGPVYALAEDHVVPGLLFAGTEYGVYVTRDDGKIWHRLKGGLPTIAVRDIAVQRRENDLVLATFGRGFYVLDDYSVLRTAAAGVLGAEAHLFPVRETPAYIQSRPYALPGKAFLGETFYMGENLPPAAMFTYHLRDGLLTRKEKRQKAEQAAQEKGTTLPYPTYEQLRAEDEEEPPAVILTVADADGNVVRRLNGPVKAGLHRVMWDLRFPPTTPAKATEPVSDNPFEEPDTGPLTAPGAYSVALAVRVDGVTKQLAGPVTFTTRALANTTLPAPDRAELAAFQLRVGELQRAVTGASRVLDEVSGRLAVLRKAAMDAPAAPAFWKDTLRALELRQNGLVRRLRGDRTLASRNDAVPPAITDRVDGIIYDQYLSTGAPTGTNRKAYEIAAAEFGLFLADLRVFVERDLRTLESALEAARAPWTPGRIPEWKQE